jgi:hypothetical protein
MMPVDFHNDFLFKPLEVAQDYFVYIRTQCATRHVLTVRLRIENIEKLEIFLIIYAAILTVSGHEIAGFSKSLQLLIRILLYKQRWIHEPNQ